MPDLAFLSLNPVLASFPDVVKDVTVCRVPVVPTRRWRGRWGCTVITPHTRLQSPQQQVPLGEDEASGPGFPGQGLLAGRSPRLQG